MTNLVQGMNESQVQALFNLCVRVDSGYLGQIAKDEPEAVAMRRALTLLTQNLKAQKPELAEVGYAPR